MTTLTKTFLVSLAGVLAGGLILLGLAALLFPRLMPRMMMRMMRQMEENGCEMPETCRQMMGLS
jgi:hypothetical protein